VNILVIVEGAVGEMKVYREWVPYVNPQLSYVPHVSQITDNNFSIVSGGGYPYYFTILESAIEDCKNYGNIDRLVLAVDSEELSYSQKYAEVAAEVAKLYCPIPVYIVIQHFCLETWALGNVQTIRPHPQCPDLRKYLAFYNVRSRDPELLPAYQPDQTRAQFAEIYLKRALNDKFNNLTYNKHNPQVLLHIKYFESVKRRLENTHHINSFSSFLAAFIEIAL
jgi:hypothetical protein